MGWNVAEAMKAERRFGSFLKLAAAAGKMDELAHAQLTLIAPNEVAMDRWFGRSANFKAFIADKAKALALYNQHVIKGAISKASVQAGPRDVTTLSGRAGTLETGDNGALMSDGIRLEDQVIEASNGVIFISTEVLLP